MGRTLASKPGMNNLVLNGLALGEYGYKSKSFVLGVKTSFAQAEGQPVAGKYCSPSLEHTYREGKHRYK